MKTEIDIDIPFLVQLAIFIVACAYFYEKTGLRIF